MSRERSLVQVCWEPQSSGERHRLSGACLELELVWLACPEHWAEFHPCRNFTPWNHWFLSVVKSTLNLGWPKIISLSKQFSLTWRMYKSPSCQLLSLTFRRVGMEWASSQSVSLGPCSWWRDFLVELSMPLISFDHEGTVLPTILMLL